MNSDKMIEKKLKELGFGHNESKVYVALTQLGEANATNIAKKAGLPRTTALSILRKLEEENYVSIQKYHGRSVYWIESPQMLRDAFENRVRLADELGGLLADLYRSEADFPYAKIYDTKARIRSFIEKTILDVGKNGEILTIENPNAGNYQRILSEEFFYSMLDMKRAKGVATRTLVTAGSPRQINPEKTRRQSISMRELPPDIVFQASFWIIGDMLVLFSGKYPFIVAVRHRIIAASMRSIFEHLWAAARSVQ
ncbi:MAG TPA: helix-turn-helix domain-containing protein [Rectinemataceae bacterium]|nr:helix-turn-helix domain-containing protein [Rectinemataceae bacterium]